MILDKQVDPRYRTAIELITRTIYYEGNLYSLFSSLHNIFLLLTQSQVAAIQVSHLKAACPYL